MSFGCTHHTLKPDQQGFGTDPMTTSAVDTSTATGTKTILVAVGLQSTGTLGSGELTDNKGNTYTRYNLTTYAAGGGGCALYYCANASVGTGHTWSLDKAAGYETNEAALQVQVWSDTDGGTPTVVFTNNTAFTGSITPTQDGAGLASFWLAADFTGGTYNYTVDANWTQLDEWENSNGYNSGSHAWRIGSGTGSHSVTWASTGSIDPSSGIYMVQVLPAFTGQTAYPNADVVDGAWTPSTGADNFACIDDATDTEWIATSSNTTGKFGLAALSTPGAGTQTLAFRASGSPAKKLIATLIEGAGTSRGTLTVDPLPAAATAYSISPSGITNYGDLDVQYEIADATTPPTAAVTYGAAGTGASGTTSCTPSYPTGISASTSELILAVTGRSNTADTSAAVTGGGWTQIGALEGGVGTWGVDTGTRRVEFWKKDTVTGSETGTITVTLAGTTANTLRATIHRVEKNAGYTLGASLSTGADTTNDTSYSATGSTNLDWAANDLLLIAVAQCIDTGTQSAQSITASGVTFGTRTNRASTAVTNGNDHRHIVDSVPVTTGSGSSAPTYSYTISASGSGPTGFLRLRSVPPTEFGRVYTTKLTIPAASGLSATIGQTAETDTAQSFGKSKLRGVGQGIEADIAQAVTRGANTIVLSIGQASEADSAQAAVPAKLRAIGQSSETDAAGTMAPMKSWGSGQASESDFTQGMTARKSVTLQQASETDAAQPVTALGSKVVAIGQAVETAAAQAVSVAKGKAIGQSVETSTVQVFSFAKARAAAQAAEADSAQVMGRQKALQLNQAWETDFAQPMTVHGNIVVAIGQVVEFEVAQAASKIKTVGFVQVAEADSASNVVPFKARMVVEAQESDAAFAMTAVGGTPPPAAANTEWYHIMRRRRR